MRWSTALAKVPSNSKSEDHPCTKSLRPLAAVLGRLGKTGTGSLLAGGIEITGSQGAPPFFPDLRLTPTATVVIHDNPDLCSCSISDLQAHLSTAGWGGIIDAQSDGVCNVCPHR